MDVEGEGDYDEYEWSGQGRLQVSPVVLGRYGGIQFFFSFIHYFIIYTSFLFIFFTLKLQLRIPEQFN